MPSSLLPMDARLRALAGRQDGAFSSAQAVALGVDHTELRRAERSGELVRPRGAAYVDAVRWRDADSDERFRLLVRAVAHTREGDVVSHHAALALHGLPLWGHDAERIDLLTDVGQVVRRTGVHLQPRGDVRAVQIGSLAVVPVARAVVRTALTMGRDRAVVAGDAALHGEMVTLAELLAEVALVSQHQGRGRALDAVLSMDGLAESVGESRTRLILRDLGLASASQVWIRDSVGNAVARVDFLVEGVVLEFDGRVTYRAEGEDAAEVVWAEKRREDVIRRLGHPVERVIWAELDRPGVLGARIRAARPVCPPERPDAA
jgi:hypothetical protein